MKLSAFSAAPVSTVLGRLTARLRQLSLRTARTPASEGHPPLPRAPGAYGLLVGDDHHRRD